MAILRPFAVSFTFYKAVFQVNVIVFLEATVDLSADKTATLSIVISAVYSINKTLVKLAGVTTTPEAKKLLGYLIEETRARLNCLQKNVVYGGATLMDPRFKQRCFLDIRNGVAATPFVKSSLLKAKETIAKPKKAVNMSQLWDEVQTSIEVEKVIGSDVTALGAALTQYLQRERLDFTDVTCPMQYRTEQGDGALNATAIKLLLPSATSVSSERAASDLNILVGLNLTKLRTLVTEARVEVQAFARVVGDLHNRKLV